MSRFEEASKKWDVARFLRRHGFEVRLTETGECHVRCPRCYDSKYRLYVNRYTKNWICFNCSGKGRSAVSFVKWMLDCDDPEAVRVIVTGVETAFLEDDDEDDDPKPKAKITEEPMPIGHRTLRLPADERSQPFWDYLTGRSLPPTLVRRYELEYCRRGPYRNRIIVPVRIFGLRRGWVARTIDQSVKKKKYLNSSGVHTSRLLFNVDAVAAVSSRVVLMEGVFDAFRIPDLAVCTFGKKISNHQISILTQAGFREWVFCYDGDAIEDAEHYSGTVPSYVKCYRAALPSEYDPGNAPLTVLSRAIREAEPWHFTNAGGY